MCSAWLTRCTTGNKFNVSGLCSKQNCPLANSRYATVREIEGQTYLYMKASSILHVRLCAQWELTNLCTDN